MLCKIYFLFVVIGFFGSLLSIIRTFDEGEKIWSLADSMCFFLFYTSITGLLLYYFKSFRMLVNVPVAVSFGFFCTYYTESFFRSFVFDKKQGDYL